MIKTDKNKVVLMQIAIKLFSEKSYLILIIRVICVPFILFFCFNKQLTLDHLFQSFAIHILQHDLFDHLKR